MSATSKKRNDVIPLLFVAAELAPWKTGGIANVVQKLGNALAGQPDIKLTVLGTTPSHIESLPTSYHHHIDLIGIRKPRKIEPSYHIQLQMGYRLALAKWLRRNPEGVIHFHIFPGARTFLAAVTALRRSAVLFLTCYDWPPFEIPYNRHQWAHWSHWYLSRTLLGHFSSLVANSRYIADGVRSLYPTLNPTVIPNGVSAEEWSSNPKGLVLNGAPRILHWGALWEKKGVDILIRAFGRVRSNVLPNAHLYIAGEGPDERRLKQLVSEVGAQGAVTFLGRVNTDYLHSLITTCDIAVFPSAYEGFGIAIMEAMACGKAVVTTAQGGPREFIADWQDGVLVLERNASTLALSIQRLANSPDLIQRMGENARRKAQSYDWDKIAPRYVELYREALSNSVARA